MKNLVINLLAMIILSSFTAETTLHAFDKSATEISTASENSDSEKNTEEEKAEKETEKDKINYFIRHRFQNGNELQYFGLHLSIITSAYLSLPEIPPDQV